MVQGVSYDNDFCPNHQRERYENSGRFKDRRQGCLSTFADFCRTDQLERRVAAGWCGRELLWSRSALLSFYSFAEGLSEPDNQTILDAIDKLQATLDSDFAQLGDLIVQQAQIIETTVNRDAMAAALANSDVATARIQAFLSGTDVEALETAESASIEGVQFFSELNLTTAPDLAFFLPGFMKAGMVRIFVIASEPPSVREPASVIVESVTAMVTLLQSMIDSIKSTINAAHMVVEKSHMVQCSVIAQIVEASATPKFGSPHRNVFVIDGYSHVEDGQVLQFFDAQQGNPPCEQPSGLEKTALADAQAARNQGVMDEEAFIGVPSFEQVLQSWQSFLAAAQQIPVATRVDLNGTWLSGGAPGPIITATGNLLSVDMSAYGRPTAMGSILNPSTITVTFPDDAIYTGELQLPNVISWSNNSQWTKA